MGEGHALVAGARPGGRAGRWLAATEGAGAQRYGPGEGWLARYRSGMRSGLRSDPQSWSDARHRDGLAGEQAAMAYLESRGWTVAAHRFRAARHEIDIVARRGKLVAFVEVKCRSGEAFGSPLEAVRGRRRRDLVRAARAWIDRHGTPGDVYRFDVIGLVGGRLEHLEDAFRPGWR